MFWHEKTKTQQRIVCDENVVASSALKPVDCSNSLPSTVQTGSAVSLSDQTQSPLRLASFRKRFLAVLLDEFLISIATTCGALLLILLITCTGLFGFLSLNQVQFCFSPPVIVSFFILFPVLYVAAFESSRFSATPGKMILKLKVLSVDGNAVSFWRSLHKFMAQFSLCVLSTFILAIVWMTILLVISLGSVILHKLNPLISSGLLLTPKMFDWHIFFGISVLLLCCATFARAGHCSLIDLLTGRLVVDCSSSQLGQKIVPTYSKASHRTDIILTLVSLLVIIPLCIFAITNGSSAISQSGGAVLHKSTTKSLEPKN